MSTTLTFEQVLEALEDRSRPCSKATLRRYFKKLHIKPEGAIRTRPARYAQDVPDKVITALGERIVTMPQLLAVKAKAQKARKA